MNCDNCDTLHRQEDIGAAEVMPATCEVTAYGKTYHLCKECRVADEAAAAQVNLALAGAIRAAEGA